MGHIDLSSYEPTNGTTNDGNPIAAALAVIQTAVNGNLDSTNISPTAGIPATAISGYPTDATKFLRGDGAWAVPAAAGAGFQLDYVERVTTVTFTATTSATANTIITGTSQAYDGTAIWVEFGADRVLTGTTAFGFSLYDGTTELGIIAQATLGANVPIPVTRRVRIAAPGAGTHQFIIKAFVDGGTGTVTAGAGTIGLPSPAYLLVTKA